MNDSIPSASAPLLVAIDFDGTVTQRDVVDAVLERFGADRGAIDAAESDWTAGKISSAECMRRQFASVKADDSEMLDFLAQVELDPGFGGLKRYAEKAEAELLILSDGFGFFIRSVLLASGFFPVPFRANDLRREGTHGWRPLFPFEQESCGRCGHCKKATLKALKRRFEKIVFIGDGLSDRCAVDEADRVFAKKKLAAYCAERAIPHQTYSDLNEVAESLQMICES